MEINTKKYLSELSDVLLNLDSEKIQVLIANLLETRKRGGLVFVVGNGGSAATASHFVCDLQKTILGSDYLHQDEKKPFKVICLNDNVPLMTAWANDYSFEEVFAKPFSTLASTNDFLIVITGSGNSKNITKLLDVAKQKKIKTFALLGFDGGLSKNLSTDYLITKSNRYGFIEDSHSVVMHLVTEYLKLEKLP